MEEFSETYLGRIHALTSAYSLLSSESWQTVPLSDILLEELHPFLAGDRTNVVIDGDRVMLEPRAALALAMALHELTTNAVKHGALSVPAETLVLDWVESNGPEVTPPTHRGFGMTLIERGLEQDMSAQVEIDFAVTGVHATVRAPLAPQAALLSDKSEA
jgi:two-component sensor histidine kinase